MYTANTMASAIEALGMSLPNSSNQIAIGAEKREDCRRAGEATLALLKADLKPRDIMTRKAFENAITVTIALGGSTNAVLHLLAIAQCGRFKAARGQVVHPVHLHHGQVGGLAGAQHPAQAHGVVSEHHVDLALALHHMAVGQNPASGFIDHAGP